MTGARSYRDEKSEGQHNLARAVCKGFPGHFVMDEYEAARPSVLRNPSIEENHIQPLGTLPFSSSSNEPAGKRIATNLMKASDA